MPESPTARAPAAMNAAHQFLIDASGEHLEHRVERFRRGDAQAVHETALDATLGQEAGHLLPAAMHHHQPDATFGHRGQLGRQTLARILGIQQRAADFDQQLHSRPSASAWPSTRFMF